jgi:predicted permease
MIEFIAAVAFWLVAWSIVGKRWRSRRIDSDAAALLMSTTSAASLGIFPLIRQELNALLVVVLILFALGQFVFARYALRVLANDRPQLS